ncbi:MAG: hypothetical protein ABFD84_14775 [Candidatus Polarisedimenticolia bacterium]|nr:hypothetical protein [bacterium]
MSNAGIPTMLPTALVFLAGSVSVAAGALGTRRRRLRVVMGVAGCVLSGLVGVAASCRQNMLEGERHTADTAAIAAQAKLVVPRRVRDADGAVESPVPMAGEVDRGAGVRGAGGGSGPR